MATKETGKNQKVFFLLQPLSWQHWRQKRLARKTCQSESTVNGGLIGTVSGARGSGISINTLWQRTTQDKASIRQRSKMSSAWRHSSNHMTQEPPTPTPERSTHGKNIQASDRPRRMDRLRCRATRSASVFCDTNQAPVEKGDENATQKSTWHIANGPWHTAKSRCLKKGVEIMCFLFKGPGRGTRSLQGLSRKRARKNTFQFAGSSDTKCQTELFLCENYVRNVEKKTHQVLKKSMKIKVREETPSFHDKRIYKKVFPWEDGASETFQFMTIKSCRERKKILAFLGGEKTVRRYKGGVTPR
ncbi:hypothetical protein CAPTEDRAFT_200515 [Capitella teleta]|uniref:Uncharacterized protein n=1 Tax=Capitella teleta TaxID=283909 RepID=R7U1T9_CAPTE|nr:hypothetical protein CAPTEDRAFT_200515 [Capitella teleta]|eukprot:ELT99949.1 hypothetical protein CAPTEDRAFT_200515 [Capitella teleta]